MRKVKRGNMMSEKVLATNDTKSMLEKHLCPLCGKKMHEVIDSIAKKKTGHQWRCDCMPKGLVISIG